MGQINIGGTSASVQLQGNNTITSDQAFTFPDTGGELVTNTSGGGQVVGYQQGIWIPSFGSTGNEGTVVYSAREGSYSRVGNTVTLQCVLGCDGATGGGTGMLKLKNLPYVTASRPGGGRGVGPCYSSGFSSVNPNFLLLTEDNTEGRYYYYSTTNGESLSLQTSNLDAGSAVYQTITYQTSDTTWQPINGATIS